MREQRTLDALSVGRNAVIERINMPQEMAVRLQALGFIPGGRIRVVHESPWGDPVAYLVCGTVIALRRRDAKQIEVTVTEA
ncbi:MAG: ferrous iron transport protein A [Oscillospiraceae bacterium]|nr:ferrous iron transport protein A [Oscillospiraceae bacterium]